MPLIKRRTRLISFRVYEDEYEQLRGQCAVRGIRSISEFARVAIKHLAQTKPDTPLDMVSELLSLQSTLGTLEQRVAELEERLA